MYEIVLMAVMTREQAGELRCGEATLSSAAAWLDRPHRDPEPLADGREVVADERNALRWHVPFVARADVLLTRFDAVIACRKAWEKE